MSKRVALQLIEPSGPTIDMYPRGICGGWSLSQLLQAGHGAPAPQQLHASGASLAPPHGLSMWSSQTQRAPRQMLNPAVMTLLSSPFVITG